jgi:signal transduction histidine kinase
MARLQRSRIPKERPRLVLRFVVWTLVAFLAAGILVSFEAVREVRLRAEELATFHATFVANAVLAPMLRGVDVTKPITGATLETVDATVKNQILDDGRDVRVKIWNPNGTVIYSDATELIGMRFPEEAGELGEVMDGHISSGVTDLKEEENFVERRTAAKLFQTYVPLRDAAGRPVAVAEVYQRYAVIDGDVKGLIRTLSLVFGGGLVLLYAALLPIALSASRTLRDRNTTLSEQTEQLSALLAREQETVAELRRLDRMKDDFVSAASHELRTPLTAIIGTLQTLERPEIAASPTTRDELLSVARHRAERLYRLVRNLLRSAHLEGDDEVPTIEDVDVGQVLVAAIRDLPDVEGRVRADIIGVPQIRTDRQRLEDILSNLVENALKFSPSDSLVEVSGRVNSERLVIEVGDHGIGIEPEDLGAVFDRFHQIDRGATRRFGGLGMGLHLVQELTNDLGGTIKVQSRVGLGTVFTLSIPFERTPAQVAGKVG